VKKFKVESEPVNIATYLRPVWVTCAIAAIATIHYMWLILLPHETLVCFIPDDAFYELQLARHFLASGKWSFDGGYTTTTGFHLLNVYLMSLAPRLLNHPWLAIKFWMAIGLTLSILSVFTITTFVNEKFGSFALVPAFSPPEDNRRWSKHPRTAPAAQNLRTRSMMESYFGFLIVLWLVRRSNVMSAERRAKRTDQRLVLEES